MYERITGDNPYETPMMIYPASHYTMGGLWVDYNLMSNVPGLHVIGEANFSDHGANRLGASALMQGLADGYFVIPYTISNYLANEKPGTINTELPEFKEVEQQAEDKINKLLSINGKRSPTSFHKELGKLMWDKVGMARNEKGLKEAIEEIPKIREEFWQNINVTGESKDLNIALERANRVADFLEFSEIMAWDALERDESCGAHFREEHQTEDGEAKRNDEDYTHVAAWEYKGVGNKPERHVEELEFENVELAVRSYK
jgi:succinate dehydrogenase / fumarate reductase flavoprotein subunit